MLTDINIILNVYYIFLNLNLYYNKINIINYII